MSSGGFRSGSDSLGGACVESRGTKRKSAGKSVIPTQPPGSEWSELEEVQKRFLAFKHANAEEKEKDKANSDEKSSKDDLYSVLGLNKECSPAEMRASYKKLLLRWHPDRLSRSKVVSTEVLKKFKEIQHAYYVLSDEETRFLYDIGGYDSDDKRSGTTAISTEELEELFNQGFRDKIRTGGTSCSKGPTSIVPAMAQAEYDVFISFRKDDTGNNFTSHLLAALNRKGINVFQDFDEIFTRGHPNMHAIEKSRVSIIILSKNYGSSFYCLDELAKILECKKQNNQMVLPVFHQVSPSDLSDKMESFGGVIGTGDTTCRLQMKMWRAAFEETARLPGYILAEKSESELIDEIVRDVCMMMSSNANENLLGMDSQIQQLLSLLCIQSQDVRTIGIWGMGGIGKTSFAREICRRISGQYETCFFVEELHGTVQRKGHDYLREEFFSKILEVEAHTIGTSDIKTSFLRSRLRHKRVLVVLDDVTNFREVETLVGKLDRFGPGSRIIITSRNRRVLVQCKVNDIYEVKPLDVLKSLRLFCCYAFPSNLPPRAYWKQSLQLVKFASGNPLVLRVFGSLLRGRSKHEWGSLSRRIQQTPPYAIQVMLTRSYCGLEDNEKSIFLDIASFFRGKDKDDVSTLLDGCGFFAHVGIGSLIDKSLIAISDNRVDMHNLIQDTAREIVYQESAEPGKRSRLWNPKDIRDVFIDNAGTAAIEGIFLDMSKLSFDASPTVFEKMYNLRLLKFYSSKLEEHHEVSFSKGLDYLPSKLRLLHWENYPLRALPRNFDPKNLVELNLPNSCIEKLWKGTQSLEKLRKMKLCYSQLLLKIPRLSRAKNLEHIDLEGCKSLIKISSSIRYLKELVSLNLKGCSKLQSCPSTVSLESLEVLNLSGCSELEIFPDISPNVKELYLGETAIREVPSSIKNLAKLVKLDLQNSGRLENLPTSICKLKYLEILNLSDCSRLESFPELSRHMKSLWFLDLSNTAIKELPASFSFLIVLQELRLVNCRNLVKLPDNLSSLKFLRKVKLHEAGAGELLSSGKDLVVPKDFSSLRHEDPDPAGALLHIFSSVHSLALRLHSLVDLCLRNTDALDIPEELGRLSPLNALDLSGNDFQRLPESIGQFSKLESLSLSYCKRLESIPELPNSLAYLDAHSCKSLEKISWSSEQSPMFFGKCLELNVDIHGKALASALIRTQNKQKQASKGSFEAGSLTVCFPANALPELLNFVNAGSSTFLMLPSWLYNNRLGFAFFVVVAFEKHYYNEGDFAIRCMCNLKSSNGQCHTLERFFYCWSQSKRETRIRGNHMCIFYDYSMYEPLAKKQEADIEAYFSFYPVDGHNRLLAGCKVTSCAVYMLTAEHENKTIAEQVKSDSQNSESDCPRSEFPEYSAGTKNEANAQVADEWTSDAATFERLLTLDKPKGKHKRQSEDAASNAGAAPIEDEDGVTDTKKRKSMPYYFFS